MDYPEDIEISERPKNFLTNEDSLRVLILILTMLMIIIGLPSFFSGVYEDPLPAIVTLGFLTIILTLFYLASKIEGHR